jgi:dTDP-4-dehydrorhamnose reductase
MRIKLLILGSNGMLGNTIFRYFLNNPNFEIIGICRNSTELSIKYPCNLEIWKNLANINTIIQILNKHKPDIVINCIGVIKQLEESKNVLNTIPINSLFPHELSFACSLINARLIHFSTDCVFSGLKGNYNENDNPDPIDLYGRSKLIGEVSSNNNTITLRTSIIGHELNGNKSLLNWFLSMKSEVKGYKNAFFSGLTTLQVAKTLEKCIIPDSSLTGLYHLSSDRISKFDLLNIISEIYEHNVNIFPDTSYCIDRSLNSEKLKLNSGYIITPWYDQINEMYKFK